MTELLGLLAGIVGVAGYGPYARDIIKGTTRPEQAAWLIWGLEYTVLFGAQLQAGAAASLWLIGLQCVGVFTICGLSFRYGARSIDKQSYALIGCVVLALGIWYHTQQAAFAIIVLLLIESIGVALTARKVYRQPGTETLSMWACVGFAGLIGVLAVGAGATWILYAYPMALVGMGLSVIGAHMRGVRELRTVACRCRYAAGYRGGARACAFKRYGDALRISEPVTGRD
jgi:hypothetical protein